MIEVAQKAERPGALPVLFAHQQLSVREDSQDQTFSIALACLRRRTPFARAAVGRESAVKLAGRLRGS